MIMSVLNHDQNLAKSLADEISARAFAFGNSRTRSSPISWRLAAHRITARLCLVRFANLHMKHSKNSRGSRWDDNLVVVQLPLAVRSAPP